MGLIGEDELNTRLLLGMHHTTTQDHLKVVKPLNATGRLNTRSSPRIVGKEEKVGTMYYHYLVVHNGRAKEINYRDFDLIMRRFRADKTLYLDKMYCDISNPISPSTLVLLTDEHRHPYFGLYMVGLCDEGGGLYGQIHAFVEKTLFRVANSTIMEEVFNLLTDYWKSVRCIEAVFDKKSQGAKRLLRSLTLHRFDSLNEVVPNRICLDKNDINFKEWDATFSHFYRHPPQVFRRWSTSCPYTLPQSDVPPPF